MAADFFTIEAWTRRGLQRFVILFFVEDTIGENGLLKELTKARC